MNLEINRHLGSRPKAFEKFLEEAYEIHGDDYSYHNFNYINCKTKGLIQCNTCGTYFWMLPTNHICKGQGCPKCHGTHKIKSDEWIAKCQEKFDYDYSETEYIDAKTKVKIICHEKDKYGNEHGEFWKTPRKHLNEGQGCPKCSRMSLVPYDEFIRRAVGKHGDKYTYHEDKYKGCNHETLITCPIHGDFLQKPQLHTLGHGCPKCGKEISGEKGSIPFDVFVERAREVHGDEYQYSEDDYKNFTTKTKIICSKHGEFWNTPEKHVRRGVGCPKCRLEKQSQEQLLPLDEVIRRSVAVHGHKYDYSEMEYKGNSVKMKIICPIHGEFWQMPTKHWIGQGCPKCNQSHLEREIELILQDINDEFIYQATKKDLSFLEMKSLDFYLPKKKIAIECQGIQHFEDCGFLKCAKNIERDKEKFQICNENDVTLVYYTNLEEKTKNNDFYNDKIVFFDVNNLKNFISSYETAN